MPEENLPKSNPIPLPDASTSESHPLESHTPINPSASHGDALQVRHEDPHHKHHLLKYFFIGMFFASAVIAVLGAYYLGINKSNSKQQATQIIPSPAEEVACTMDVKECPDRSFVSRQSPTCEFTACPTGNTSTKTYSNTENTLSFNYPSDWRIVPSIPGSSENSVSLAPADWPENEGGAPPISGEYFDNPNNLSIEKWEEEIDKGKQISRGYYIPDAKKTTINGYTAYISDKGNCHPYGCPQVIIVGDKRIFIFQHLGELNKSDASQDIKKYGEVFEEIYSSFKFN